MRATAKKPEKILEPVEIPEIKREKTQIKNLWSAFNSPLAIYKKTDVERSIREFYKEVNFQDFTYKNWLVFAGLDINTVWIFENKEDSNKIRYVHPHDYIKNIQTGELQIR